jgi:serine/threonine protein phosphatase PrpC
MAIYHMDTLKTRDFDRTPVTILHTIGERPAQEDFYFATVSKPSADVPARLKLECDRITDQTNHHELVGSTGTIAVISPDNILTPAHIGDSPLTLFVRDIPTGKVTARTLLTLHKTDDTKESDRVEGAQGKIDDDSGAVLGIDSKGIERKLSMTRSWGSNIFTGVSHEVEILEKPIDLQPLIDKEKKQVFLCVASDGLSPDCAPVSLNEQAAVIEAVYKSDAHNKPEEVLRNLQALTARKLAEVNAERARDGEDPRKQDNITALFMELPKTRRAQEIILGVFDGHGGPEVAKLAASELEKNLVNKSPGLFARVMHRKETQRDHP